MSFRANTTITVLRGSGTDRFGDAIDVDVAVYTRVPVSLMQQAPNTRSRPVEGRTDQVRSYTLRTLPNVVLQRGDRIRDERTGAVYTPDFEATADNVAGHTSRHVTLRKVT